MGVSDWEGRLAVELLHAHQHYRSPLFDAKNRDLLEFLQGRGGSSCNGDMRQWLHLFIQQEDISLRCLWYSVHLPTCLVLLSLYLFAAVRVTISFGKHSKLCYVGGVEFLRTFINEDSSKVSR